MSEMIAKVSKLRKIPAIWLLPIVAVLLGTWAVVFNYLSQGPRITIAFATATGIEAGKTKIKTLDVELGVVESVELAEDMRSVILTATLEPFAEPLLREDTEFWVERPRIGPGGVSGLGTLLSGGYIKLAAGTGKKGRRKFAGLETPPVTPAGTPGLRVNLFSRSAGSLSAGDPVLFRGYRVGEVESVDFENDTTRMSYKLFIENAYANLVTRNTRFWNTSGISLKTSADGVNVDLGSLQTLLVGGVAFDWPDNVEPGPQAESGDLYTLLPNRDAINRQAYDHYAEYVVEFAQSMRGLAAGAPVLFRGIPVGVVERIMFAEAAAQQGRALGAAIPVLIRVEPARLGLPDSEESLKRFKQSIEAGVRLGLRGVMRTGNLITGKALIDFDFYGQQPAAVLGEFAGRVTIPTIQGGLGRIEEQALALLAKLNALPLEPAVKDLDALIVSVRETVENLNTILGSEEIQAVPASLEVTLYELNSILDSFSPDSQAAANIDRLLAELTLVMKNLEAVTRTLADKPNSIIFSPPVPDDPEPQKRAAP